jgi:aryl-alcohol dehydrogenase-like predicted oxidoreductase
VEYRDLGSTDLSVSVIGHGLWGMGAWAGSVDEDSVAALRASNELGCTFYDSAQIYGEGRSDRLLASFASQRDTGLVLASKLEPLVRKFPLPSGLKFADVYGRDHVLKSARNLFNTFGDRPLSLVQFHVWDDAWLDDPEFMTTIDQLRGSALALHVGISLNGGEPWTGLRAVGSQVIDTVQVVYNIFEQRPGDELFPACLENDVGVIARVPLDEGSLGGTFTRDTRFPETDWRSTYFTPERLAETMGRIEAIEADVSSGLSLPELALRFCISHGAVSTVICGMRSLKHVRTNVDYMSRGPLDRDVLDALQRHRWDRA